MKMKVKQVVLGGVIAALYVVLTIGQNVLLPGSVSAAIQFRVSEVLCVLAVFTPAAIPGLTIGCLLANVFAGLGAVDLVFGPLASFLAALTMYLLRRFTWFSVPFLSLLMPAVCNGLLIGLEIVLFFSDGAAGWPLFWITAGQVALGELGVLMVLGIPFCWIIRHNAPLYRLICQ